MTRAEAIAEERKTPPAVLLRPIAPCEILPNGRAGLILIHGHDYLITYHGHLPPVGDPVVTGYRLTKPTGEVYDVPHTLDDCDCGDRHYRNRACKHLLALMTLRIRKEIL